MPINISIVYLFIKTKDVHAHGAIQRCARIGSKMHTSFLYHVFHEFLFASCKLLCSFVIFISLLLKKYFSNNVTEIHLNLIANGQKKKKVKQAWVVTQNISIVYLFIKTKDVHAHGAIQRCARIGSKMHTSFLYHVFHEFLFAFMYSVV
jgi:predicted metalloprotease